MMSYKGGGSMTDISEEHIDILEKIKNLVSDNSNSIIINGDVIIEDNQGQTKKKTQQLRNTPGFNSWKQKVKQRDKVCQCCGTSSHLEVHHVSPLSEYPQLGTDMHNGMVLCQICHRDYHDQWKGSEGPATLVRFLRENGQYL